MCYSAVNRYHDYINYITLFYCPLQIGLSTLCIFEEHVARLFTCASKCPLWLCCVWCASFKPVHPAESCLGGFDAFSFLLPSNIFHSGHCTVCNCVQNHVLKGKRVLRKIFKHPLLPLLHFCILNLTPTNIIWRLGYFCSVRQSSSELVGWPLCHWWPLFNVGLPEQILSGD